MIIYRQPFRGEYPITQAYGEIVPGVTYQGKPHTGIDYGCPEGTEIMASADGVVMFAGYDTTGYGNCVILQHNDNRATLYAHLSKIGVVLRKKVLRGELIGLSGNSGNSTGPHLHFEARKIWYLASSHFDPMTLPLMSFDDSVTGESGDSPIKGQSPAGQLKGADAFQKGDLLRITAPLGAKAFYSNAFDGFTTYQQGQAFFYTGESVLRKEKGLTYMRVVPAAFSVWVAVNDGDCQILDKDQT